MRRVRGFVHITLLVAFAAILTGCSYQPRVLNESASVLEIRADYLASNPEGEYNDFIRKGEVTRGMNYTQVLASWGAPDARIRTNDNKGELEAWSYTTVDDINGDWIQFTFQFEKKVLADWDVQRHVTMNGRLAGWEVVNPHILPPVTPGAVVETDTARRR
jgi:hypothetical protein